MKQKAIFILLSAAVLGLGILYFQNIYQKHIIFLTGNRKIITNETWIVGDNLFYRLDNHVKSIEMSRVLYVKKGGTFDAASSWILAKYGWVSFEKKVLSFLSKISLQNVTLKKWPLRFGALIVGTLIAGIVCFSILFFKLKHHVKTTEPKKKKSPKPKKKKLKTASPANPPADETAYAGQEAIVQFFLMVFKHQKGITEEGEAQFRPVDTRMPDGNFIYELRVKVGDEWAARRMTIGPIGEESGSRSTCYYVIFDDHLVVKIPPLPVKNFDKYIQSIHRDSAIAEKLQPKECLIPRVSVILKKVHPFYEDTDLSIDKLEKKYIDWLKKNDTFQSFLKIGESFVYFMDLSRYFFLGNILKTIHDIAAKLIEESSNQPDILWNSVEFEARYGSQNVVIADNLHPVYTSFENRMREILQENYISDEVSSFQLKEWFLVYLAGGKLSAGDIETKPGVAPLLNRAVGTLFKEKETPVALYRNMIRTYVVNKNLQQHKNQLSGLITNLVELLAWMNEKKIAMRDLKPDNLLVAGNPSKFPQFLESAALYSIGFIDVETAVSFDAADVHQIKQPPIGGTPAYSTPSHMLRNNTLIRVFEDLPLILHLQDWYATVGMIYTVVTGERLFDQTAKTLLQLKASIKDNAKKKQKPLEVLAEASISFWRQAVDEFETKVQENEKRLNYISAIVSKDSKPVLMKMISQAQKLILKNIQQLIASQDIFKGDKIKKNLYAAPYLKIEHFKLRFMAEKAAKLPDQDREKARGFLDKLIYLKKQSAQVISTSNALKKSVPVVSASDLLKTMFAIVLVIMHQRQWGTVAAKDTAKS